MNDDNHGTEEFPERGARAICGASYDLSPANLNAILNMEGRIYACYAIETCPETGRLHAQFYMYFKNCRRLSTLRAAIKSAKFIAAGADHNANRLYCLKMREQDIASHGPDYVGNEATFKEAGTMPDADAARECTLATLTKLQEISFSFPDYNLHRAVFELTENVLYILDHFFLDDDIEELDDLQTVFDKSREDVKNLKRKRVDIADTLLPCIQECLEDDSKMQL